MGPFPDVAGRRDAGAVVDGQVAWIVGGRVADGASSTAPVGEVLRIDLARGTAEVVEDDARAARSAPVVARDGSDLVIAGGSRGRAADVTTVAFDLDGEGWRPGPDLPWPTTAALADGTAATAPAIVSERAIITVCSRPGTLVELFRIDLEDLDASVAIRAVPPTDVDRGAVALTGSVATVVIVGEGEDLNMVGIDRPTGRIRWQGTTPAQGCTGGLAAAAAPDVAVLRDTCSEFGSVDSRSGIYGALPAPPTVGSDDGRLVAVGDVVLWVDPGADADAGVTAALVPR